MGILPDIFDGRECAGEARGCRVMGGNDISHGCTSWGTVHQNIDTGIHVRSIKEATCPIKNGIGTQPLLPNEPQNPWIHLLSVLQDLWTHLWFPLQARE